MNSLLIGYFTTERSAQVPLSSAACFSQCWKETQARVSDSASGFTPHTNVRHLDPLWSWTTLYIYLLIPWFILAIHLSDKRSIQEEQVHSPGLKVGKLQRSLRTARAETCNLLYYILKQSVRKTGLRSWTLLPFVKLLIMNQQETRKIQKQEHPNIPKIK